jgi:hypothetical protein
VRFDVAFACPVCTEPLEAATLALPCRHAFCRRCLELAMARAAAVSRGDPEACVCPLCRACLFDPQVGGGKKVVGPPPPRDPATRLLGLYSTLPEKLASSLQRIDSPC